ncbi:hypothetical protein PI125_g25915, partial [Phytophthora idaei]
KPSRPRRGNRQSFQHLKLRVMLSVTRPVSYLRLPPLNQEKEVSSATTR